MIDTLDALPALTASRLAVLEHDDPELHAGPAETLVATAPGAAPGRPFVAGAGAVLAALDLADGEIGAFRLAPPTAGGADAGAPDGRIAGFDRWMRARLDAPDDIVFVGGYGPGAPFAAPGGVGLCDMEQDRVTILAPGFARFLIAQADACAAARDQAAAIPAPAGADVPAIFAIRLAG